MSELKNMEAGIQAWIAQRRYYKVRRIICASCGKKEERGNATELCSACALERRRQRRRAAQQERRGLQSGRYIRQTQGIFRVLVPKRQRCVHCGREFLPERSTARFCSTRCRVALYRSKQDEHHRSNRS